MYARFVHQELPKINLLAITLYVDSYKWSMTSMIFFLCPNILERGMTNSLIFFTWTCHNFHHLFHFSAAILLLHLFFYI
jgi:hypothetical protein